MTGLEFEYPLAFALLALLPPLLILRNKTRETLPFTGAGRALEGIKRSFWKRHYDEIFFGLAFLCLVLSLVNIGYSRQTVEEYFESKWIFLALDVSGSMKRPINQYSDKTLDDLAIDGIETFIDKRHDEDYIGIVAFSSYPKLLAPLTFDKDLLKSKVDLMRSKNRSALYRQLTAGGGTNASEAVWLALSAFFAMLPDKQRLSVEEIAHLRSFLLGPPGTVLDVPPKLQNNTLGTGMAVILFTDGRIEPSQRSRNQSGRTPNLVNIIRLMKTLGVRLYIIAVGGDIDEAVKAAMARDDEGQEVGRIFVTPKQMELETIEEVYHEIDNLEANRNLTRVTMGTRSTRLYFAFAAFLLLTAHILCRSLPGWRRI